jgi:hypothetical protein
MDGGFFCQPRFILERHMFLEEKKQKRTWFSKIYVISEKKKKTELFLIQNLIHFK